MFLLEKNTVLDRLSNCYLSAAVGVLLLSAACAPITPLPSPPSPPMPSSSSSGGSSSGSPPSSGSSGQSGGQQSGQQGQSSGGSSGGGGASGGIPSGGGLPGGGSSGGEPGGEQGGQEGGQDGADGDAGNNDPLAQEDGTSGEPSWEVDQSSGGGDDGWETSNEIPGTPGSADGASGGGPEGGQEQAGTLDGESGTPGSGDPASGEEELDRALRDFDGEILAERDIIKSNSAGGTGSGEIELPTGNGADGLPGNGGPVQTGGQTPSPRRAMPPTPAPPRRVSGTVPNDIRDARDDDIIARQLREAAMQEEDLELKEKLWAEYRKYKKG